MQIPINQIDKKLYQVGGEIDSQKLYQLVENYLCLSHWSHGDIMLRLSPSVKP